MRWASSAARGATAARRAATRRAGLAAAATVVPAKEEAMAEAMVVGLSQEMWDRERGAGGGAAVPEVHVCSVTGAATTLQDPQGMLVLQLAQRQE